MNMIRNILTHWRTSLPGFTALVTSVVSLVAMIINHTCTQASVTACIIGIFTGLGLLFSQDYTQGAKAHAESQVQISELQDKVNLIPQAISSGDTSMIQKAPMTPVSPPGTPARDLANPPASTNVKP